METAAVPQSKKDLEQGLTALQLNQAIKELGLLGYSVKAIPQPKFSFNNEKWKVDKETKKRILIEPRVTFDKYRVRHRKIGHRTEKRVETVAIIWKGGMRYYAKHRVPLYGQVRKVHIGNGLFKEVRSKNFCRRSSFEAAMGKAIHMLKVDEKIRKQRPAASLAVHGLTRGKFDVKDGLPYGLLDVMNKEDWSK